MSVPCEEEVISLTLKGVVLTAADILGAELSEPLDKLPNVALQTVMTNLYSPLLSHTVGKLLRNTKRVLCAWQMLLL